MWWCSAGTWSHNDPPEGFDYYVFKTVTMKPRINPCPLVLENLPGQSYLNRIGVRNPGIEAFLENKPTVPGRGVVSILGFDLNEWVKLAELVEETGAGALELNVSCPNTEGVPLCHDSKALSDVVWYVREKFTGFLGVKLSPDTPLISRLMVTTGVVDYLSVSNTLATSFGGLSGTILRPFALKAIKEIRHDTDMLIVGGGGIVDSRPGHIWQADAYMFIDAGASELSIGTGNILRGAIPEAASVS